MTQQHHPDQGRQQRRRPSQRTRTLAQIEHGLSALRDREGRGLISLVCDALERDPQPGL